MLEELRQQLTQVDDQILDLVARRQDIVRAIGEVKRGDGRPTRDYSREKYVIDSAREQAQRLGLPLDLAENLMRTLIESSLERQEQDNISAGRGGTDRAALVIGGCGKMGSWFANFLASQGFGVTVADRAEVHSHYSRDDDWSEHTDIYDLIVVAAPIKISADILRRLAAIRPAALIFDVASLKSPLRQPLRALADAGCAITSVHPMFGPDTRLLSGRHVIFCNVGHPEATAKARQLFDHTMVQQVEMGLEDHDRLIAYVLGLSHAMNIAFMTALRESGEAATQLAQLSSTTFDAQLSVTRAVSRDNPHMYFEIQSLNDYRLAPLAAIHDALSRLRDIIERNDEAGFVRLMELGRSYLQQREA